MTGSGMSYTDDEKGYLKLTVLQITNLEEYHINK